MKDLLTGIAITVVGLIVLVAVNMFCNMHGMELDAVVTGTFSGVFAMLIYRGLTKKEK